jgi:repressor LexA
MTVRRQQILNFVRGYQRAQGVPPSSREVARKFRFSQPAATKHLQALAREGQFQKFADGRWGLSIEAIQEQYAIPIYGTIPAGLPTMHEQEPDEKLNIDPAIFGVLKQQPGDFWLLRVKGDSMTGAAIEEGDLVALVRKEPQPGDIVAALVDETTTTLKRFVRERGRSVLRAENPRYPDLTPSRIDSQGVVVGVIRRSISTRP